MIAATGLPNTPTSVWCRVQFGLELEELLPGRLLELELVLEL
jgi:hypothetical protein